jgi:hypothetical protein
LLVAMAIDIAHWLEGSRFTAFHLKIYNITKKGCIRLRKASLAVQNHKVCSTLLVAMAIDIAHWHETNLLQLIHTQNPFVKWTKLLMVYMMAHNQQI